jgi:hypothetical protein
MAASPCKSRAGPWTNLPASTARRAWRDDQLATCTFDWRSALLPRLEQPLAGVRVVSLARVEAMKKKLLIVLAVLGVVAVGICVAASLQPAHYHVERSVVIAAPPAVVYDIVSDFRRFGEWSPWEKLDPGMKKTFDGPPKNVGSTYAWQGNDDVGEGRMTIVAAAPNQKVDIKLEFFKPWQSTSQTSWNLASEGEQTKFTWAMDGNNEGLVPKMFSMFMNMDKMLGKDFEAGLTSLKELSEKEAKTRTAAGNPPGQPAPAP